MTARRPRIAAVIRGAVDKNPKFGTKYSGVLAALQDEGFTIDTYDATMSLPLRLVDAALTFKPDLAAWRRSLRNNPFAFRRRSSTIAARLASPSTRAEVILQFGGVFDARWNEGPLPSVIYTDYTARMAGERPAAGRAPRGLERWVQLERRTYERAHAVCVRSEMVRDSLINRYDVPPRRVHVVGGGANIDDLRPLPPRAEPDPPTALFIGRDFQRKGGDLVLRAFAIARRANPRARLLFATRRAIPAGFPTEGVVVVSHGWNRARMRILYANADFLVLPARLETWGDVLLEAMGLELPCIGVRGEPMQEIIHHGTDGALIAPGDVEELAAWMCRLLGDVEMCRAWGVRARRRVEQQFLWRHVAQRLAPHLDVAAQGARS